MSRTMSPQLAFSSTVSALVMAAFALTMGAATAGAAPPAAPVAAAQR